MLFDTQTLTRIVERSFDLAMSGALPAQMRAEYLARGKRLREQLMHLLGARFDADSAEFKQATDALHEANHALHEAHHALAEAQEDLEKVSRAMERLARLASMLEKALKVAGRSLS